MNSDDTSSRRAFVSSVAALVAGGAGAAVGGPALAAASQSPGLAPVPPFRRVVTGYTQDGKSTISSDGPVPEAAQWQQTAEDVAEVGRLSGNEVWLVDRVPVDLAIMADPLTGSLPPGNQPTPGGIIVRIARYEPGLAFPMHSTWTVDFAIVISGSLELGLEAASTVVRAGDIVVQRGTPHSWRVVGDQPCVVAFVMVDAAHGQGERPES